MTDFVHDAFEIPEYIGVPEPKDTKALRFQNFGSFPVTHESFGRIVLSAIQFDDKPAAVTGEVGNEACDRHLAAKMPAFLLQDAQLVPKPLLGIGDVAPQPACGLIGHCPTPTPAPPRKGEGK